MPIVKVWLWKPLEQPVYLQLASVAAAGVGGAAGDAVVSSAAATAEKPLQQPSCTICRAADIFKQKSIPTLYNSVTVSVGLARCDNLQVVDEAAYSEDVWNGPKRCYSIIIMHTRNSSISSKMVWKTNLSRGFRAQNSYLCRYNIYGSVHAGASWSIIHIRCMTLSSASSRFGFTVTEYIVLWYYRIQPVASGAPFL